MAPPEASNPLRTAEFYTQHDIDLRLSTRVVAVDTASRHVQLANGDRVVYDGLLLATGAEPVHLELPGADLAHVHYLRTLARSAHRRANPR